MKKELLQAGGGFSSCIDLFMQALADGKRLKSETVQEVQSAKPAMNSPNYGLGMQIFDKTSFGHNGGGPGSEAWVKADRMNGLTIIVLGNQNTGSGIVVRTAQELFAH